MVLSGSFSSLDFYFVNKKKFKNVSLSLHEYATALPYKKLN